MGATWLITLLLAEPSALSLDWRAPEGACPDRSWVQARVQELSGASSTSLAVEVEIREPRGPGRALWLARLRSDELTAGEVRTFRGSSCREVTDAVVVVIAMALGAEMPSAATPSSPSRTSVEPRVDSTRDRPRPSSPARPDQVVRSDTPAAPPPPETESTEQKPKRSEPSAEHEPIALGSSLGLQALSTVGQLPRVGLGLSLYGALRIEAALPLRVELSGQVFAPSESIVRPSPEAGGRFVLAGSELRLCALPWTVRPLDLGLCAGGELGFLWASGFGVTAPTSAFELVFGVATEVEVVLAWTERLSLILRFGAVWPVVRPMFRLNPLGDVHQTGPIVGRVAAGVEFELF